MKIVIHLLSLSSSDDRSAAARDARQRRRELGPQERGVLLDAGSPLFGDEDVLDGGLPDEPCSTLVGSIATARVDEDDVQDEGAAGELRLVRDALLRSVPGGVDEDERVLVGEEELAWSDDRLADEVREFGLRDAPARREVAEPLCSDCARRLLESGGALGGGVQLPAPLRGTLGNLDGWCLEVDPDRVVLRDLHSDLSLEFRRIAGQWVFDPGLGR